MNTGSRSLGLPALDGAFWRRMARFGARGPEWFARYAPPAIGVFICALAPGPRRAIASNIRRIRGSAPAWRDALDVARTFATYASSLAEVLAGETPKGRAPDACVSGMHHVDDALSDGRGIVFVTAHTAGWDVVGRLVWRDKSLRVMIVEAPERDVAARSIQDAARRGSRVEVAHVGDDALAALPLLRHLREGGAVALQIDRVPRGRRARPVMLLGGSSRMPEGPLRLAALTGAPVVPIFSRRTGHRRYQVVAYPPIRVPRSPSDRDLDAAASSMAGALEDFVRAFPTQWFHFREE